MITGGNSRWRPGSTHGKPASTAIDGLGGPLDGDGGAATGPVSDTGAKQASVTDLDAVTSGNEALCGMLVIRACRWATGGDGVPRPAHRDALSKLAYQLSQHAFTPLDPRTLQVAWLRATVLDEQGCHGQAADIWGRLATSYQLTHQTAPAQQARARYAVALHHAGRCREAVSQLAQAWDLAIRAVDRVEPTTGAMLQIYLAVLIVCGLDADRAALLAHAATLPVEAEDRGDPAAVMPAAPGVHRLACEHQALNPRKDPQ